MNRPNQRKTKQEISQGVYFCSLGKLGFRKSFPSQQETRRQSLHTERLVTKLSSLLDFNNQGNSKSSEHMHPAMHKVCAGVLVSTIKALWSLKGFRRFAGNWVKTRCIFFFFYQFLILSSSFIYHKQSSMEHPLNARCCSRHWEHTGEQHHGNPCFRGGLRPNRRY